MCRAFLRLTLAALISVLCLAPLASAGDGVWEGGYEDDDIDLGWFTDDPGAYIYYIGTAKELAGLAALLSSDHDAYETHKDNVAGGFTDMTILLTNDIDLTAVGEAIYWRPMGDFDVRRQSQGFYKDKPETHFKGKFDGQGHTVTYRSDPNEYVAGLFSILGDKGTVQNLSVDARLSTKIESGWESLSHAGGIAFKNEGTISDCFVSADISSAAKAGGIAARNDGIIQNCEVSGDLSIIVPYNVNSYLQGGITALNGFVKAGLIRDSLFRGVISADTSMGSMHFLGGIAAQNSNSSTIENSSVNGNVLARSTKKQSYHAYVGGVAGDLAGYIRNQCQQLKELCIGPNHN
jgi:hypothetical protein